MIDSKGRFMKGHKPKHKPGYGIRTSQRLIGHPVSKTTREKLRKANLGLKHGPASEERKKKISNKLKGNKNGVGRQVSNFEIQLKRKLMTGNTIWKLAKRKTRDTIPELLIEAELKRQNVYYIKQAYICGFSVDFYLPEIRTIIECDGDYWHNLPEVKIKDAKKNAIWAFEGFKVMRFWEHEIKKSAFTCVNSIPVE